MVLVLLAEMVLLMVLGVERKREEEVGKEQEGRVAKNSMETGERMWYGVAKLDNKLGEGHHKDKGM